MRQFRWLGPTAVALVALLAGAAPELRAQGVTTGAVSGQVTDSSGNPLEGAQVRVLNRSTGAATGGVVRSGGLYNIQGLDVGSNYSVTVRRVGFTPQTRNNVRVTLSQATRVDFQLGRAVTQLEAVTVNAAGQNALITPTKTGVSTVIGDSALRRLPTLNRNFTDFARLTPQVTAAPNGQGGVAAAGQNARTNNIQIDGVNSSDVFGLSSTGGQAGAQANGRTISLEAVKEYQVLLSPFDVRQGNFNGALINAVTKSGTNDFAGTAVAAYRNEKLERDVPFIRNQPYSRGQYDFSFGGPIVHDHAFFFLAPSFQTLNTPASGPYQGEPASFAVPFIPQAGDIQRFQQILQQQYGLTAGSGAQVTRQNPLGGLFSRLDFNLPGISSRLVLRDNYQQADNDVFSRSTATNTPTVALTSNLYTFRNRTNQAAAQLYTNWQSGLANEFIIGYSRIRDKRDPSIMEPSIAVDLGNGCTPGVAGCTRYASILAGADASSQANQLDQDIFEFTDNLTKAFGSHTLTLGTKNQFFKIRNLFVQNIFGTYSFSSLDSLAAGVPRTYSVGGMQPGGNPDPNARFKTSQLAGYFEDQWQATPNFNFTYGLRVDAPVLNSHPFYNPVIDTIFGIRTDRVPNHVEWSPRLGFNWDVTGDQRNQLRGGAGLFQGAPSYVFISNAFGNTGANYAQLSCGLASNPGNAPIFNTAAIRTPPTLCQNRTAGGPGVGLNGFATGGQLGAIATIDPSFRFPQSFRGSFGYDRAVTRTLTATFEALYTHAVYSPFYQNLNLKGVQSVDRNGRQIYGSIKDSTGVSTPVVVTRRINTTGSSTGLVNLSNQNKDYAYQLTGQLDKRFASGVRLTGSYTYGHSYDVQSLTSDVASSNFRFGRTISTGGVNDVYLGRSAFDLPHRVLVTGSYTLPTRTDLSVIYDGHSGSVYDYVYGAGANSSSGDLNGDGVQGNDLIYVPTSAYDPNEIRFAPLNTKASASAQAASVAAQQAKFENFIQNTPCLRDQRGRIMDRNSCRNPWDNDLDVSIRQSLPNIHGNNLSVQLDIFNFLNLLNPDWGKQSFAGGNSQINLLNHQGQVLGSSPSAQNVGQGVFSFNYPTFIKYNNQNIASYYQMQLSVRYAF